MASRKQIQKSLEELDALRSDLVENIFPDIKMTKSELDLYHSELLIDEVDKESIKTKVINLENKITLLKNQADIKVSEILGYHKEIFEGDAVKDSIKETLENYLNESGELFTETEAKKEDFDLFYEKVFGKRDKNGEIVGGLEKEINKYESRYETLLSKIESLLPAATTAGLAKVFSDKVSDYKKSVSIWTWVSFGLLVSLTVYYIVKPLHSTDINQTLIGLLNRLPFIIFAVWLVVFTGNRRAENKKLEESYKHKEVLARSFVGYKEQIGELEESDIDKILLKSHMKSLLDAININSGDFLDKKGDNSPLHDAIDSAKTILSAKKKIIEKPISSVLNNNEN